MATGTFVHANAAAPNDVIGAGMQQKQQQARRWTASDAEALCDLDRADPADAVVDVLKLVGGHMLKHERFLRFQQNAKLVNEAYAAASRPAARSATAATTRGTCARAHACVCAWLKEV